MSSTNCPRAWEVEAARDGRLTGTDLSSHVAHQSLCVTCTDDAEAFERLARDLRAAASAPPNQVALRRIRHRVLAGFDARHARGRRGWSARSLTLLVAALLVLVAGVALAAWHVRTPATVPARAIASGSSAPAPAAPQPMAAPAPSVEEPTATSIPPPRHVPAASAPERGAEAEDRAYLHVVALLREGREPEARRAARTYVRDYPTGFRRDEMQRIVDAP